MVYKYSLVLLILLLNIVYSIKISPFFKSQVKYEPIDYENLNINIDSTLDAGEELILSKYLDDPKLAKRKSCVDIGKPFADCDLLDSIESLRETTDPFSFSGFFTVNETYNSNLFYWFFEAQSGNDDAPIIIWLQGGPGASSLFGVFSEVGPYELTNNLTLLPREVTWNSNYSLLFIDNPVMTGFSFTDSDEGLSNNELEISENLFSLLVQFYQVYPEYANNELYIAGESYGGKYVPSLGYYILEQNSQGKSKVNLAGISIGDGLCDPVTQVTQYANLAYYTGLADDYQKAVMEAYQAKIVEAINQEQWMEANDLFTDLINGPPDYFTNITGEPDYYDIRRTVEPSYGGNFVVYCNSSSIRQLLHIGNHYFQTTNDVYLHLQEDVPKSVKPLFTTLLDQIKVLFYNGNFDFIVGVSTTEAFVPTIDWQFINNFMDSHRTIWKIPSNDVAVAGYVKQFKNLTQIVVRDCGHICPFNQPERVLDMITRFIENQPFPNGKK